MDARLARLEDQLLLLQQLCEEALREVRILRRESAPQPVAPPAAPSPEPALSSWRVVAEPAAEPEGAPVPAGLLAGAGARPEGDDSIPRARRFYCAVASAPGQRTGIFTRYQSFADAVRDPARPWTGRGNIPWHAEASGRSFETYRAAEAH